MSLGALSSLVAQTDTAPFLERDQLLGDWSGVRPALSDHGLELFAGYTAEVWGNTTGGFKQGVVYTGLLDFGLEWDLEKAVGWQGGSVSATWLWLSGRDASEGLTGNFLTISDIAGFNTLRMWELWFQQKLLDDHISIRFGQLTADSEFLISDYAGFFLNGTFGWPAFAYTNIPEGGPAYPMGTLGTRVSITPVEWFTFQSAVFQGNVFAQNVNRHGFRWRLNADTGYTFLNEAQGRWNQRDEESGLAGQAKVGVWFQTGRDADVLADTTASGNSGYYAIIDQMLFRESGVELAWSASHGNEGKSAQRMQRPSEIEKSPQGLGWFGRVAAMDGYRNFVNFYFDTGWTYLGLIPSRDHDTAGMAFAYAQVSDGAREGIADVGGSPIGAEMVMEVSYQAQVTKWLTVQPDLQIIINPGATTDLDPALVVGARVCVEF